MIVFGYGDIVVTIPKHQVGSFRTELSDMAKDPSLAKYFKMYQRPSLLDEHSNVFFVICGKVRYKASFKGFSNGDFNCQSTGNAWDGFFIKCQDFEEYDGPIINGFRGFRYRWW